MRRGHLLAVEGVHYMLGYKMPTCFPDDVAGGSDKYVLEGAHDRVGLADGNVVRYPTVFLHPIVPNGFFSTAPTTDIPDLTFGTGFSVEEGIVQPFLLDSTIVLS